MPREKLLDKIITKLCEDTTDTIGYGVSLAITGAGGFGKTAAVTALCHNSAIKDKFPDGVVFIELGPQAIDSSMKLKGLYRLLTDEQCDINVVEQQILQLTSLHCRNLLVVIDDVWHVEDAEPIVKAFGYCTIVLTTRMTDIKQYIPSKQVISVGPMEQSEAISLLTSGEIDISQLSQEDVCLLNELAQDVHLWPLLLSLIRGQLSASTKRHYLSSHEAIENVKAKLRDKGLTAFDKNNFERSCKLAAKSCIEVSLAMLKEPLSDKLKTLLLWTGIGTSLQTAVLQYLWRVADYEARDIVDTLSSYGIVQFTYTLLPPHNKKQNCVEVHAVIGQYIIEEIKSNDVQRLSPFGELDTCRAVKDGLVKLFQASCGVHDTRLLSDIEYLHYRKIEIEFQKLPNYIQQINMCRILDPHTTIIQLKRIQQAIQNSPNIAKSFASLIDYIDNLIADCHKILKSAHISSRILNQKFQHCLVRKNYDALNQIIDSYMQDYSITAVAQQAVVVIKNLIPHCKGELLYNMTVWCEKLQITTNDYHVHTLLITPVIKILTKELLCLVTSLEAGSPYVEQIIEDYKSGKFDEEFDLVRINQHIKLQEIAPKL